MRKIPGENIINHDGKNTKNKLPARGKTMFGYNQLGFGAGGKAPQEYNADFLVVATKISLLSK